MDRFSIVFRISRWPEMFGKRRQWSGVFVVSVGCCILLAGCANADQSQLGALTTQSPRGDAMVRCIEAKGYEATLEWDGSISGPANVAASVTSAWQDTADKCASETGYGNLQTLNSEQRSLLYRQETAEYQCLLAIGKRPDLPPSEATYLDTFGTGNQYYAIKGVLEQLSRTEVQQVVAKCPPPTWFLNVDALNNN